MNTCCSVLGLILLVLTNLCCLIAFSTPYWVVFNDIGTHNQGLWAFCSGDSCSWVFEDKYMANAKMDVDSDWWLASVGLVSAGFGMALFALIFASAALCCDCRGCNASHTVAGLLLLSFLSLSTAAVVFGVCAHKYEDVHIGVLTQEDNLFDKLAASFRQVGWSYWLDIGSAGMALLTALVYIFDGRNKGPAH